MVGFDIMQDKSEKKNYIDIKEKEKCCGCGACMNACGQKCISMCLDDEGFTYPQANLDLCINCGECVAKCPMIYEIPNQNASEPYCYVAFSKEDEKIMAGSSGGIFEVLCEFIYNMDGVVYGASLDEKFQVRHCRAIDAESAKRFRKSKYLQSDTENTYAMAKRDLEEGRTVLFSGTPCQIAGLYGYLGKRYQGLYTIDIVCHGVPSKAVFMKYLETLERKYNSKPVSICWRDKRDGWGPNKISVKFKDGQEILQPSSYNSMQWGFLNNLYLRPSCYDCQYAKIPRVADISLGDFWGYEGKLLKQNCNKGLSMIVISSQKGMYLFKQVRESIILDRVELEYCKKKSIHLSNFPTWNQKRSEFMQDFKNGMNFEDLSKKYIYPHEFPLEHDFFCLKELINEVRKVNVGEQHLIEDVGDVIWERLNGGN